MSETKTIPRFDPYYKDHLGSKVEAMLWPDTYGDVVRYSDLVELPAKFRAECGDHCNNWCWHEKAAALLESWIGATREGR